MTRVDHAAISRLIKGVETLRSNGYCVYERVWEDANIKRLKNLNYWSKSTNAASEATSTLRELRIVGNMLEGFLNSLQKTIVNMEEDLRRFKLGKGLTSLPNELLSEILEYAGAEGDPYFGGIENGAYKSHVQRRDLSLVCRRFRQVVDETPRMWSSIDSTFKMPNILACLKKSKSAGLRIHLKLSVSDSYDLNRQLSALNAILPHSSRWEELHIYVSLYALESKHAEKFRQSKLFSDLRLPSLHTLHVRSDTYIAKVGTVYDDIKHLYQYWDMPNLRFLTMDGLPRSIVAPNLSHAIIEYSVRDDQGTGVSQQLQDFIAAHPNVEKLEISFFRNSGQGILHTSVLDMPKLRILSLDAHMVDRSFIRSFMDALRAPALCELKIDMLAPQTKDDRDTALNDLFPQEDYPALEVLKLNMRKMLLQHRYPSADFHLPFTKLRGLRALHLDTPGLVPFIHSRRSGDADDGFPPALRTLELANCGNVYRLWLFDLIQWFQVALNLKQVKVSSRLNKRQIDQMFVGDAAKTMYVEKCDEIFL